MSQHLLAPARAPGRRAAALAALVAVVLFLVAVSWAKWLPYTEKTRALGASRTWDGTSLLADQGASPSWAAAWHFAGAYTTAVWRALLASLLVAAAVDALVPRRWLLASLDRRGTWRQAAAGGLASLPTMMCTCCTAPLVVSLRRSGVPVPAALAYWLGNPVLNPAVLVFLFLTCPWQWGVTRLLVGVALVVLAGAVVGSLARPGRVDLPEGPTDEAPEVTSGRAAVTAFLRSLVRLALVLVPEYAVVVLVVGGFSGWASRLVDSASGAGVLGLVAIAVLGTLLVLPTGGEIPVLLGLAALGAGSGVLGVLLVALPALSLPSTVMVARALTPRVALAGAASVAAAGLVSAGVLSVLG